MALKAVPAEEQDPLRPPDFEELYRDNRNDLFAYVAGLLRDRATAEDVTSLAFERAWRKWDRFDSQRGSPRGWLFGIARNAALDELRKRKKQAPLTTDPPDPVSLEAATGDLEREAAVTRALDTLPPSDRELIALKFFAGMDNTEIAGATGISATNVGTRVHRAISKLRSVCKEDS